MIGPYLKALRERLPHFARAAHFAAALGCTREHYRRIEAGTGHPSTTLMKKIIKELELGEEQVVKLWGLWGLARVPRKARRQLLLLPKGSASTQAAEAVLAELRTYVDLGEEDELELTELIHTSILKEEIK
jgi:hypothetical protein